MWECCRHLQKAQTLDGSGPMRLPRQLHASYSALSVSKAPKTGHCRPYTSSRCECRRYWLSNRTYLLLLGWRRCTLLQAAAIATAMMKRNVPVLVTGSAV